MVPKLAFAMAADKTRHVFDDEALSRLARSCAIVRAAPLEEFSSAEARAVLGATATGPIPDGAAATR